MNILQEINSYYEKSTIPWINIHGEQRVEGFRFFPNIEDHDNVLLSNFNFKENENVLDAGCGVGYPTINFAKKYPKTNFYLINNSEYQIKMINPVLSNMNIIKGDFHKTGLESGFFNSIYFLESFSHSLFKNKLINEVYRILKPGGKIFCLDFCRKPNISLSALKIHRKVYYHFPISAKLMKNLFKNRNFTEIFFNEFLVNNITTESFYDTDSFYCYDRKGELTDFGEVHKDIHLYNAHVQTPVFFCYKK